MQMAAKHARIAHGTYSMDVLDTWRASEATAVDRPFEDHVYDFGRRGHRANHERSQSSEAPCTTVTCLRALDYVPYTHTDYR